MIVALWSRSNNPKIRVHCTLNGNQSCKVRRIRSTVPRNSPLHSRTHMKRRGENSCQHSCRTQLQAQHNSHNSCGKLHRCVFPHCQKNQRHKGSNRHLREGICFRCKRYTCLYRHHTCYNRLNTQCIPRFRRSIRQYIAVSSQIQFFRPKLSMSPGDGKSLKSFRCQQSPLRYRHKSLRQQAEHYCHYFHMNPQVVGAEAKTRHFSVNLVRFEVAVFVVLVLPGVVRGRRLWSQSKLE